MTTLSNHNQRTLELAENVVSAAKGWAHVRVKGYETDAADKCLEKARADLLAHLQSGEVGINGLTEAETSASMSVRGLSKPAQPEQGERTRARSEFWKAALGDNSKLSNLAKAAIKEAESSNKSKPEWIGLSVEERDNLVGDLVDYGTETVAPLYSVIEQVERNLKERNAALQSAQPTLSHAETETTPQANAGAGSVSHEQPKVVEQLVSAAEIVCATLEHPTNVVHALQMWNLRDALKAYAAIAAGRAALSEQAGIGGAQ